VAGRSQRTGADVAAYMGDLRGRQARRVQLNPDGSQLYLNALEDAFGGDVDYAMLIKIYGIDPRPIRYSPSKCIGAKVRRMGPDPCDGR
jgi:hypothetical protein